MKTMSEPVRAALNAENEKFTDWAASCRLCGAALRGTIKELKEHKCGEAS